MNEGCVFKYSHLVPLVLKQKHHFSSVSAAGVRTKGATAAVSKRVEPEIPIMDPIQGFFLNTPHPTWSSELFWHSLINY